MRGVLFDLDGTLLPIDFDAFVPRYLAFVGERIGPRLPGVDLVRALWAATQAMLANDGSRTNEDALWQVFGPKVARPRDEVTALFLEFYERDFPKLGTDLVRDPAAARVVAACRAAGMRVALATNPVFPRVAIEERLRWAGLDAADFDLVTSVDRMSWCKPQPQYYRAVADELDLEPSECWMVGNDVAQDLAPAAAVGMRTFLVDNAHTVPEEGFVPDDRGPLAAFAARIA